MPTWFNAAVHICSATKKSIIVMLRFGFWCSAAQFVCPDTQHPAHSGFRGDCSILEETMSSVIRRQRATIEALRLQVSQGGGGL